MCYTINSSPMLVTKSVFKLIFVLTTKRVPSLYKVSVLLESEEGARCCGAICCQSNQEHQGKPLLFSISALGSFFVRNTTPSTNGFMSHPKDEASWLSVLHKDTTGTQTHTLLIRNTRARVRCSLPLGHDTCQFQTGGPE